MTLSRRVVGLALFLALFAAGPVRMLAQNAADQVHDIDELKEHGQPPVAVAQVVPQWPEDLDLAGGKSFSVIVEFIIDQQGVVQTPRVVKSPDPKLEQLALAAVRQWKFKPGEINGQLVRVRCWQEFIFNGRGEQVKNHRPPVPVRQDPPTLPERLVRAGLNGLVLVDFTIDEHGVVREPRVVRSNNPWFERPAIDAVLSWKFQPAETDGKPVSENVRQELDFSLGGVRLSPTSPPVAAVLWTRPTDMDAFDDTDAQNNWHIEKGKGFEKLPPALQWEKPPFPTYTGFPVYPFEAVRDEIAGRAEIEYLVGTDGRVMASKVVSATKPEFGLAVIANLDTWRFRPALHKDGTPSLALLHTAYDFQPDGSGDVPVSDLAGSVLYYLKKNSDKIAALNELDGPLKPVWRRPPVYPTARAKDGKSGTALIEFYVDWKGDAQLPRIVSSSAPEFGYAAVQAVATWRFEVPLRKGKPVAVRVQIPINFEP